MEAATIAELIGEPLLEAIDRGSTAVAQKAKAALDWLREHSGAPDGIELRAPDGSRFTGVVVVERNEVLLMWCFKHDTVRVSQPTAGYLRQHQPERRYGEPSLGWDEYGPYAR